jgi:hypothetical protein
MAKRSADSSYWIGRRVESPVWTDAWMMGDRYGNVVAVSKARKGKSRHGNALVARVLMDRSGKLRKFWVDELTDHGMPGRDYPKESGG